MEYGSTVAYQHGAVNVYLCHFLWCFKSWETLQLKILASLFSDYIVLWITDKYKYSTEDYELFMSIIRLTLSTASHDLALSSLKHNSK